MWRLRAVLRTHGTRAASGLRPAGYYGPPARSSLTVGVQVPTAKRGPMPVFVSREARATATSGAPRGERAQTVCADCVNVSEPRGRASGTLDAPVGAPLPSLFRRGKPDDGVPGAANNTGGGALL